MDRFEQRNTFSTGRKKGAKNRLTNDVRQIFDKVYDGMGVDTINPDTGKPYTGTEAMLMWARDNQTEFYRLYAKMIPQTAELTGDVHEDFLDELLLEEEQAKLIEGNAKVVDAPPAIDTGTE